MRMHTCMQVFISPHQGKACLQPLTMCREVAIRDPTCAGNGVIEMGGNFSSSPLLPSPAPKRARYPFPAECRIKSFKKKISPHKLFYLNPRPSTQPVMSTVTTQPQRGSHQDWLIILHKFLHEINKQKQQSVTVVVLFNPCFATIAQKKTFVYQDECHNQLT